MPHVFEQVASPLAPEVRNKIISLITLDVHARDVVQALITDKSEGVTSFKWQSQLRYYFAVCVCVCVCVCVAFAGDFVVAVS